MRLREVFFFYPGLIRRVFNDQVTGKAISKAMRSGTFELVMKCASKDEYRVICLVKRSDVIESRFRSDEILNVEWKKYVWFSFPFLSFFFFFDLSFQAGFPSKKKKEGMEVVWRLGPGGWHKRRCVQG